ncbi:MAG TPA: hypothetical protein VGE63_02685 [Candidatus Paceibacterota bacterium]
MLAARKVSVEPSMKVIHKFRVFNNNVKFLQQNLVCFQKEYFQDFTTECLPLLSRSGHLFLKKNGGLALENFERGWVKMFMASNLNTSIRMPHLLSHMMKFVDLHEEHINSSLWLIRMNEKWFKSSRDHQVKASLLEKSLSNNIVLSIEEWLVVFLHDLRKKAYLIDTPWYLTSRMVEGKVVLIRKENGKVKFKKIKPTSRILFSTMFVLREKHLREVIKPISFKSKSIK